MPHHTICKTPLEIRTGFSIPETAAYRIPTLPNSASKCIGAGVYCLVIMFHLTKHFEILFVVWLWRCWQRGSCIRAGGSLAGKMARLILVGRSW